MSGIWGRYWRVLGIEGVTDVGKNRSCGCWGYKDVADVGNRGVADIGSRDVANVENIGTLRMSGIGTLRIPGKQGVCGCREYIGAIRMWRIWALQIPGIGAIRMWEIMSGIGALLRLGILFVCLPSDNVQHEIQR